MYDIITIGLLIIMGLGVLACIIEGFLSQKPCDEPELIKIEMFGTNLFYWLPPDYLILSGLAGLRFDTKRNVCTARKNIFYEIINDYRRLTR
jgi:hypothetical protein